MQRLAILAAIVLLFAAPARAADPAPQTPAVTTVMGFAAALSEIRTGEPAMDARHEALGATFDRFVDFDRVVPKILGRYWTAAAPEDRAQMSTGLRLYLVKQMSALASPSKTTPVKVLSTTQTPWGAHTMVTADVQFEPNESPQKFSFLLSPNGDAPPRIVDVIMGGISATTFLSAQCQSLMMNGGAGALMAKLGQ